ncbi:F-box only protein 8-like [Rutidosis leptorrhynchoides]|uniref:F-box only protein 8-like n=1 Tax=Rutidosis leptorrhynchoides TaxID=125765 RepID=UPI003A99BFC2
MAKQKAMSNYMPSDIQIKIFCHLPIKSLIRFRSVSKEWKSLIDSSEFNSDYIVRQTQRPRLLLRVKTRYVADDPERGKYCWIVDDDDSFPQHKISMTYPTSVKRLSNINDEVKLVGYSHGLLCFTGYYLGEDDDFFNRYVIWNPSIRKSVSIDALYYEHVHVGFGVCPNSLDPKIVRINMFDVPYDCHLELVNIVWRVEVFTLSGGVWRSPLIKLPRKWFNISLDRETPIVINGFIYWCADVGKERSKIYGNILRDSLGAVQSERNGSKEVHNVWIMDHVSKLFTKLFSITLPERCYVVGFRDNDQLIIGMINEKRGIYELVAYEPNSNQVNDLGLYVTCSSLTSYTESLLLLNQSGTLNDDEGDEHATRFVES